MAWTNTTNSVTVVKRVATGKLIPTRQQPGRMHSTSSSPCNHREVLDSSLTSRVRRKSLENITSATHRNNQTSCYKFIDRTFPAKSTNIDVNTLTNAHRNIKYRTESSEISGRDFRLFQNEHISMSPQNEAVWPCSDIADSEYEDATRSLAEFHKQRVAALPLHDAVLESIEECPSDNTVDDYREYRLKEDIITPAVSSLSLKKSISKKQSMFDLSSLVCSEEQEKICISDKDFGTGFIHRTFDASSTFGQFFDTTNTKVTTSKDYFGIVGGMSCGRYNRVRTRNTANCI